jgi:hypothetical protein
MYSWNFKAKTCNSAKKYSTVKPVNDKKRRGFLHKLLKFVIIHIPNKHGNLYYIFTKNWGHNARVF